MDLLQSLNIWAIATSNTSAPLVGSSGEYALFMKNDERNRNRYEGGQ